MPRYLKRDQLDHQRAGEHPGATERKQVNARHKPVNGKRIFSQATLSIFCPKPWDLPLPSFRLLGLSLSLSTFSPFFQRGLAQQDTSIPSLLVAFVLTFPLLPVSSAARRPLSKPTVPQTGNRSGISPSRCKYDSFCKNNCQTKTLMYIWEMWIKFRVSPTALQPCSSQAQGQGSSFTRFDLELVLHSQLPVVRFCTGGRQPIHGQKWSGSVLHGAVPQQERAAYCCSHVLILLLPFWCLCSLHSTVHLYSMGSPKYALDRVGFGEVSY